MVPRIHVEKPEVVAGICQCQHCRDRDREMARVGWLATLPASGKLGQKGNHASNNNTQGELLNPTIFLPQSPTCWTHSHAQPCLAMHYFCNKRVSVFKVSYYLKDKKHSFNSCGLAVTWVAVLHICVEEYKGPSPQSQLSDSTSRETQTTDISYGQLELDSVSPGMD